MRSSDTAATPTSVRHAAFVATCRDDVDRALDSWRPRPPACPPVIADAIRYAVGSRGKRLRPLLALAAADAVLAERASGHAPVAGTHRLVLAAACAIEFVHSQSLIHDDLPCMDDDAMRRGQPATHIRFGEGLAILAGDALLAAAFSLIAREAVAAGGADVVARALRVMEWLGHAIGPEGMVGGQSLDLTFTGTAAHPSERADLAVLTDMHRRKTGGLVRVAVAGGGLLAGADVATVSALAHFGDRVGLAFQIVDDVLDCCADTAALGKSAGKDAAAGKLTFPAVVGLDAAKTMARQAVVDAHGALDAVALEGRHLRGLADDLIGRLGDPV